MEDKEIVKNKLDFLLSQIGIGGADVKYEEDYDSNKKKVIYVSINGDNLGLLIGYRGKTLRSLQLLLNIMVYGKLEEEASVVVDINDYWAKRADTLHKTVDYFTSKMEENGEKEYDLQPMDARERKIIHEYITKIPGFTSESEGDGEERHVVLVAE